MESNSTFADAAFEACRLRAAELGRRLNPIEWREVVQSVFELWAPAKPKAKPSRPRAVTPREVDDAWLAQLEANPAYAGIDVRRELGKLQAWCSLRPGTTASPRRFINWLNKATTDSRSIAFNGAGATSFAAPAKVMPTEPAGWREWVRENATDPTNADKAWGELDASAQKYILQQLQKSA